MSQPQEGNGGRFVLRPGSAPGQPGLYCSATKDVFSNWIVGYAIDERMTAKLAVSALRSR